MAVKEFCCAKLSPHKKSIFGLRMGSQILYLFVLAASFLVISSSADTELSCTDVKNIFERKGILSSVDIQEQPNSDAGGLCRTRGCCGPEARPRLTAQARSQLEAALRSELTKLSDILANRGKKFDEFFRKLLQLSREEFHAMFKRTYGMIYEQHSYVFEQLFEQLERYYARGDTDFDLMMEGFFGILYQKMFTVLNSQYSFDEKYLKCVNEHMRDIQPFEDVPSKLSVQLRRAFVATRTFHKALRAGADVVRNMMQVGLSVECATAWAALRHCGPCSAARAAPACSRYCHNVLRGCLPEHADLGDAWDGYVDAVEKVADRLLGPFNIAMVVEPIDIKISEAIMSFQEHNQEISQKIFAGCGKPVLGGGGSAGPFFAPDGSRRPARSLPDFDWKPVGDVDDFEIEASFESLLNEDPSLLNLRTPEGIRRATRDLAAQAAARERFLRYMRGQMDRRQYERHERSRRDADPAKEIDFRAFEFDGKRGGGKKKKPAAKADDGHASEWGGPALERLVRETRGRVRSSRRYWAHLPAVLCSAASVTSQPCFNGSHVAVYLPGPAGEGNAARASNPEVRVAGGLSGPGAGFGAANTARAQQDALRAITARLKDAYNGVEVHWKDADDLQVSSSSLELATSEGSGSGSGDGDGSDGDGDDDEDDLPDDDEDRQDYPEGSGGTRATEQPPPPPAVGEPPRSHNVLLRGRGGPAGPEPEPEHEPEHEPEPAQPAPPRPAQADPPPPPAAPPAADPPSLAPDSDSSAAAAVAAPTLQRALFAYAFPVVCAWFGTIVTDLF